MAKWQLQDGISFADRCRTEAEKYNNTDEMDAAQVVSAFIKLDQCANEKATLLPNIRNIFEQALTDRPATNPMVGLLNTQIDVK
jgi:hypothetical protein